METQRKKDRPGSPLLFLSLFKEAFQKLVHNDPLRMAGATAFFTTFALPFILIILYRFLVLFFDASVVRSQLFQTLSDVFGQAAVRQVVSNLQAFRNLALNGWVTIIGVLFLFFVSTTLLLVIKSSINQLWRIKVEHRKGFVQNMRIRLQSVLIIVGTAVLFFLSILAEGFKALLDQSIHLSLPGWGHFFISTVNYLLSVLFVTLWFTIVFRFLPDARAPWRVALVGAFVTSLLFNAGKYLLRLLLVNNNLNNLYGASASFVLLLLFIFYASLILYYGVAFTRVWAIHVNAVVKPLSYATHYEVTDVAKNA